MLFYIYKLTIYFSKTIDFCRDCWKTQRMISDKKNDLTECSTLGVFRSGFVVLMVKIWLFLSLPVFFNSLAINDRSHKSWETDDLVPQAPLWHNLVIFVVLFSRPLVFIHFQAEEKLKKSTVEAQRLRQMSYRRDQRFFLQSCWFRSGHWL